MIWPRRRRKKKPVTAAFTAPTTTAAAIRSSVGTVTPFWSPTSSTSVTWSTTGATGPAVPYYIHTFPSYTTPEEPELIKDMGLAIEPIVGLRGYTVDPETMQLISFNSVAWPHREPLYALCDNNPFAAHDAPGEDCQCGIYAWNADLKNNVSGLFGEVYLWGDVLVCPYGYRAEIAYPKNLTIQAPKTRSALRVRDGLEEAYGIPVIIVDPDGGAIDVTALGS